MIKTLEHEGNTGVVDDELECAAQLMEVVPLAMRFIRAERRRHRTDISVTQFRALAFVSRHEGTSLSDVAEYVGLTLPSMSKMVDVLVSRKMVTRQPSAADRRRVALMITKRGRTILQRSREATQKRLVEMLASISPAEREIVLQALQILRPVFTTGRETGTTNLQT